MSTTLTTEEMKALVRRHFDDFVNNRTPSVIRQNMTSDFVDHDGPGGAPTGVDGDELMMDGMLAAIPDLKVTVLDLVAEGDRVVCRNIWNGTNQQSGRKIEFHGFVMWRFEGDRIAERWATVTPPRDAD